MSELLQKVLTDVSIRSNAQLPVAAANTSDTFSPWSSGLE
jgi:hypothetical protein